ncbi:MAG: tripartite tricarboxylate transporter substrate-binding protein [Burkholderiaceae bacterium]
MTSTKRLDAIPEIPTLEELGLKGVEVGVWQGVLAPAATSAALVQRLNAEINKALANPTVAAKLATQSAIAQKTTPAEYGEYLRSEADRWGAVFREVGIQPE